MKKIQLAEDLQFSQIIHGHWRLAEWNLSPEELLSLMERCIEAGITTFDHADIYGNYMCEELFGQALKLKPSLRDKIQIVTKCGIKLVSEKRPSHTIKSYDTSKEHIISSAENSLQKMNTDYVDVLLIHRPDPFMDPVETAEAFRTLRKDGKVRHFGVSNFSPAQMEMLQREFDGPLVTNQIELSVLHEQPFFDGTVNHLQKEKVKPMAWSPLAGGRLFKGEDEKSQKVKRALEKIAEETEASSIDVVAYAWLLNHPAQIMPIVGSGKMERIQSAVDAANITLSREQWFYILQESMGKDVD
ncbi:aldo/keto reductase [Fictibacillus barbaricus]|uniref:Aldo/keto reductase n=1 Tax=Fictibacillus barbaricus TaxID=182136 RepID=A0ABS2ZGJ8_9BACL|nr:aldo/keto reductase [Fictibacillus barbaricus]MBN3547319.1 aldo/keto reductase [Fictibacillus barbaricus]GGB48111.1 oxidoreductase [Fictibacillus barbaricus]